MLSPWGKDVLRKIYKVYEICQTNENLKGALPLQLLAGHLDHHLQRLTIQVTMQDFKFTCRWSNDFVHDKYPLFSYKIFPQRKGIPVIPCEVRISVLEHLYASFSMSKHWNRPWNYCFTLLVRFESASSNTFTPASVSRSPKIGHETVALLSLCGSNQRPRTPLRQF